MHTISELIEAVKDFAPLSLQEPWDNSGLQVGPTNCECTGVMLCVDVTPEVIDEAKDKRCNLIISHHPLLFKGLKQICPGSHLVQTCVYDAIRAGITVFSSHTALDSASQGISRRMALMLGAAPIEPLEASADLTTGLGCVAQFDVPVNVDEFVERIKRAFGSPIVRCSALRPSQPIRRIALCGGSGGEFIHNAIAKWVDAYLTSDVRYHDFVDYGRRILIADIGHFESEECAKKIFYEIIAGHFPDLSVEESAAETNPIQYL